MLDACAPVAHPFAFPVADTPLSGLSRQALLPVRPGPAWDLARLFDRLVGLLDLSALAAVYHHHGSPPYSPRLMLALALFCIAEGKPSPNDWADMANRDGPTRWLIFAIEPSASTCYAFRDRLGEDALLELNRQVLALAQRRPISPCTSASIDGTLVEADASRHHLLDAARLERGLQALEEPPTLTPDAAGEAKAPDAAAQASAAGPVPEQGPAAQATAPDARAARQRRPARPGRTPPGRARQRQRFRRAQQELKRRQGRNAQKRKSKRADPAKMVISPTDSEAAVGRDKRGVFRPLYNAQLAADNDSDLILGYGVWAQQNDAGLLGPMLDRSEALLGHGLERVLVDGGYVGGQDLAGAEKRDVQVLGPIAAEAKTKQLPKGAFSYQPEADVYACPEGKALERVGQSKQKRSSVELVVLVQYKNETGACQECPRKAECCPESKTGRTISRSEHEGSLDRLKGRMSQDENKKKYKRRAATVERLFGDGKRSRGLDRVRGRGLDCARKQLGLTVLQHNLRVLSRAAPTLGACPPESGGQGLAP